MIFIHYTSVKKAIPKIHSITFSKLQCIRTKSDRFIQLTFFQTQFDIFAVYITCITKSVEVTTPLKKKKKQ